MWPSPSSSTACRIRMAAGPGTTASPAAPSAPRPRSWSSWPTARRSRRRASFAASLLVAAVACARKPPPPLAERVDRAIARGGDFLLSQQGEDGAIRSATYAYFRDGYSLTPLALAALFALPERPPGYARAAEFLVTMIGADGKLREDADGPRYPLYSLALGALVLNSRGNERHRAARDAMLAGLRQRQLADGGWGYEDGGESNLSATVYAVGALALARQAPGERALAFVKSCQNYPAGDGGFFFAPAIADGNKAGPQAEGFRSYGSMTA